MMGYAAANESSGSRNWYKPIEGIKVKLVRKGQGRPASDSEINIHEFEVSNINTVYQGSTSYALNNKYSGACITPPQYIELGETGKSSPLKGLMLSLTSADVSGEFLQYRGHFAKTGWTSWTTGGTKLTSSENDLQAVSIRLTGELANYFDIYYSAHVSHIGWMGWAKNGENAGTQGYGSDYPMECLRILLVGKGVTLEEAGGDLESLCDESSPFLQK